MAYWDIKGNAAGEAADPSTWLKDGQVFGLTPTGGDSFINPANGREVIVKRGIGQQSGMDSYTPGAIEEYWEVVPGGTRDNKGAYRRYRPDGTFLGEGNLTPDINMGKTALQYAALLAAGYGAGTYLQGAGASAGGAAGGPDFAGGFTDGGTAGGALDAGYAGGASGVGGPDFTQGFTDGGTAGGALDAGYAAGSAAGTGGAISPTTAATATMGAAAGPAASLASKLAGAAGAAGGVGSTLASLAGPAAALAGGVVSANAADKAAGAQEKAAADSNALYERIFNKQVELNEPFRAAGVTGMNELLRVLGLAGDKTSAGYGSAARDFSAADFEADPGHQWRLSEGAKALERRDAAAGRLGSGRGYKDLIRFNQGEASQEFGRSFDRYNINRTMKINPLQSLMGAGQTSAGTLTTAAGQFGDRSGAATMAGGDARASGIVGRGNAINSAIGQGYGMYQSNELLKRLLPA